MKSAPRSYVSNVVWRLCLLCCFAWLKEAQLSLFTFADLNSVVSRSIKLQLGCYCERLSESNQKPNFFDWISELQFIGGTRDKSRKMAKESWTHVFLFILVSCLSIVHYLTRPLTRSHNIIFTRKIFTQNAAVTGVMSTNNACLCPPEIIFLESPVLDKSCVNLTSPFSLSFRNPSFLPFLRLIAHYRF